MNKLCLMLVLLLFTVGFKSHANENITSTIKWLATYTESGNGDVLFTTDTKGSICFGYWISGDAPGFDQCYSVLLAARVAS